MDDVPLGSFGQQINEIGEMVGHIDNDALVFSQDVMRGQDRVHLDQPRDFGYFEAQFFNSHGIVKFVGIAALLPRQIDLFYLFRLGRIEQSKLMIPPFSFTTYTA